MVPGCDHTLGARRTLCGYLDDRFHGRSAKSGRLRVGRGIVEVSFRLEA